MLRLEGCLGFWGGQQPETFLSWSLQSDAGDIPAVGILVCEGGGCMELGLNGAVLPVLGRGGGIHTLWHRTVPLCSIRTQPASKWKLVLVLIPLPADRFRPAH